ncbi:acyl-CoA-binding protein (ACBP)/diazepam binding inhibitor (DBI)/endozepine (EP) [Saxophila tyrrhenica]|uniref:Acyl-CoA-binding protein (ACBP)/diazepam binding inhibitor (DBI)/endozepine (EP) n=1 Tax=Saxophila tyrrhenica TaxID=1690608 RepID=A0AAV9P345_9PEZI|nr:acyl-CoA-binding protein (ACBP)/diazepam binding inhibitor (DBI)/endozepine (EP) [Saxophila tyrrhenica]
MPTAQSAEFKKAVEDSRKLKAKPGDDELLQLYALFKQGTQDPPIEQSKAPGMFELKEKAKRNAWQKVVDEGVKPADAQKKYVALVNDLKKKHGFTG